MAATLDKDTLTVRAARPQDRDAMLAITRTVWEGTDYLPLAWDTWMADPNGYLMAVEQDGRVLGLQHVAAHPDGTAWIEGIRVSEDVRGTGIGGHMLEHALSWARARGLTRARLATAGMNPASNRIAARAGMRLAREYHPWVFDGTGSLAVDTGVRVAAAVEYPRIRAFLARFHPHDALDYTEGWTVYGLSEERLRVLLAMGAIVVAADREIDAVGIVTATHRPSLKLGLLQGSREGMAAVASYAAAAGRRNAFPVIRAMLPAECGPALTQADYAASDYVMNMWELSLDSRG